MPHTPWFIGAVLAIASFDVARGTPFHKPTRAVLVDVVHRVIVAALMVYVAYVLMFDILLQRFNIARLCVLNAAFCVLIAGVSYFKMCPLTILYNKLADEPPCTPFSWDALSPSRVSRTQGPPCYENTYMWLDANLVYALVVGAINVAYFCKA